MTSRLTQVRQALADQITAAAIPGLTVYSYLPDVINVPAAVVTPPAGDFYPYLTAFDASDMTLQISVFVQRGQPESSSEQLDDLLDETGTASVFAAVAADKTLGGVVDSAIVTMARGWGVYTFGNLSYLGAELTVEVLL